MYPLFKDLKCTEERKSDISALAVPGFLEKQFLQEHKNRKNLENRKMRESN